MHNKKAQAGQPAPGEKSGILLFEK